MYRKEKKRISILFLPTFPLEFQQLTDKPGIRIYARPALGNVTVRVAHAHTAVFDQVSDAKRGRSAHSGRAMHYGRTSGNIFLKKTKKKKKSLDR